MNGPRNCHTEWSKSDREGEILYDIPYLWNLKINDTSELTKQKETHRLREGTCGFWVRQASGLYRGRMRGRYSYGVWDGHLHTAIFKMDNQQSPTVQHMELCSTQPGREGSLGGKRYTCMYDWVPVKFTWDCHTLLIGYAPIQDTTFIWKRKKKKQQTSESGFQ